MLVEFGTVQSSFFFQPKKDVSNMVTGSEVALHEVTVVAHALEMYVLSGS